MGRRTQRIPTRRLVGVVIAVVVGGWLVVSITLFGSPSTDEVRPVDAVFVLDGGGDRADRGVDLVRQGAAESVVFASARVVGYDLWAVPYCNDSKVEIPAEVTCFAPDPPTTQGEARALARLAEENDWDEILLVASTDQVWRARLLVERCWDGDLLVDAVDHEQPALWRMIYETGASLKALTVKREC
jgi:uncharacterized SAM-binding protein YcdF (DUF218 family)